MAKKLQAIQVDQFMGINTLDDPKNIDPSYSPYMVNMDITSTGKLQTRYGYEPFCTIGSASGGLSGIMPYYKTYGTNSGDYLLLFHKGTAYSVTNTNTTPSSIGTYGTVGADNGQVRGVVHNNVAVFGDGAGTNTGKYWDGTTLASLASGTIYPKYFGQFNSRLWCSGAHSSSAFYGESSTTDSNLATNFISLGVGDGTDIASFIPANDRLNVLKENSIHAINFGYDSSYNISTPKEQPIISSSGGAYAAGSTVSVYDYLYFLSKSGFRNYGNLEQGVQANLPLPLSFTIDNVVSTINFAYKDEVAATFFGGKYMCSAPLGISTTNNYMFVYNEVVKRRYGRDNWSIYQGIPARQFATYRDANKREQLLFASAFEPTVYKFNTSFSDNGFGYDRLWRSKTFQSGEHTRWYYLDIEGSKPINTEIYVTLNVDGQEAHRYTIDDSNFVTSTYGGGYIGDSYIGDLYMGSGFYGSETIPMYKYRARIRFPMDCNEGYAMYFELFNNQDNAGWSMTRFKAVYELLPEDPTYEYTVTN